MDEEKPYEIDSAFKMALFIGDQLSEDLDAWESHADGSVYLTKDGRTFRMVVEEVEVA